MDGKKKKNKKKKGNNQNKATDGVPTSVEAVVAPEQENGSASQQNHYSRVSSATDIQSVGVSESDVELERHKMCEEKYVKLQEEVRQLEDEKNLWLQKETSLEEKIKLLQNDVDSCIQKEASLGEILKDLQIENDTSMRKEAILEGKIKDIEDAKNSWILKEASINEMIARLDEANQGIQVLVKELKESREGLVQENIQLKKSIGILESRIQQLEEASISRSSTMKITEMLEEKASQYQPEAAHVLVERVEPEKTELVEKLNDVHTDSDQHIIAVDEVQTKQDQHDVATLQYTADLDLEAASVRAVMPVDYAAEYHEERFEPGDKIRSLARTYGPFGISNGVEDFGSPNRVRRGELLGMEDSRISEEIVSVPLDDVQVQEFEPPAAKNTDDSGVALSDAPLIGAPFRLISFFAKYVSGADLVHQDIARQGR